MKATDCTDDGRLSDIIKQCVCYEPVPRLLTRLLPWPTVVHCNVLLVCTLLPSAISEDLINLAPLLLWPT
jgi:hypothetical protein